MINAKNCAQMRQGAADSATNEVSDFTHMKYNPSKLESLRAKMKQKFYERNGVNNKHTERINDEPKESTDNNNNTSTTHSNDTKL